MIATAAEGGKGELSPHDGDWEGAQWRGRPNGNAARARHAGPILIMGVDRPPRRDGGRGRRKGGARAMVHSSQGGETREIPSPLPR